MFNFVDPKLIPKIICKSPCSENYEADNLISNEFNKKIRGFIAFPSIKPPVEIELQFICNVNIFYIVLKTAVGNLRCSGIELFSKTSNSPYVSIAKASYDNDGVIFCNSRKYTKESPPPPCSSNYFLCFFKSNTFRTFLNATAIKIVIFKTEKAVPCLASIEVWGQPSKNCSPKTVETIHKIMGLIKKKNESSVAKRNEDTIKKTDNYVVPDDFKDDLTYELMTVPYTLPSGKTIDQSTLEKNNKIEASFGRKPCDPFTGLKFNDQLKPILNVALKSRIDMFLLQNSHRPETFNLKRSLGTNNCNNKRMKMIETVSESHGSEPGCSDNLDHLLNKLKTNGTLISFDKNEVKTICILCNTETEYLYKLPCKHRFCRKCLLKICNDCICTKCKCIFIKSDVEKCKL